MLHAASPMLSSYPRRQRVPIRATISNRGAAPPPGIPAKESRTHSLEMPARHSLQQLKPDGHALFQQQHAPWEARSEFAVPQMAQAMHILKCAPSPIRRRISELFQTCEHSNHQQAERMASAERQLENIQSEYVRLHRDRKREVADLSDEIASLKDLVRLSVHLHGSTSSSGGSAAALRAAADNLDLRAEMARLRLELDASRVDNIKLSAEIEAVRGGATGSCPPSSCSSFPAASFDSAPPRFGDSAVYEQEEYLSLIHI